MLFGFDFGCLKFGEVGDFRTLDFCNFGVSSLGYLELSNVELRYFLNFGTLQISNVKLCGISELSDFATLSFRILEF